MKDILVESSAHDLDARIRGELLRLRPDYAGFLRYMVWLEELPGWKLRQYEVYLFNDGKQWVILDVSEKDEQLTG